MKFVYFDIGGVLVKDFSKTNKWNELMAGWGLDKLNTEELDKKFDVFELEANVGRDVDEFITLPNNYSLLEDIVGRFEKNVNIWKIIDMVRNKYKVGLLTNMYPRMLELIKRKSLLPEHEWNIIIDSSAVKMKKPDENIYLLAQERTEAESNEILFIDNTENNLVIPKALGWQTFWFESEDYEKSNQELGEFLRQTGILSSGK